MNGYRFLVALRWRVAGLLALLGGILLGASLAVASTLSTVETNRQLISGRLQPAAVAARSMLTSVINQETGERGFVITGDAKFLAPYLKGRAEFPIQVHRVRTAFAGLPGSARINDQLDDVLAAVDHWHRVGSEPEIAARRAGNVAEAESLVAQGEGKAAFDTVRREIGELQKSIDTYLDVARGQATNGYQDLRNVIIISALLLIGLVALTGFLLRRWVLVPVNALRANMRDVAGGHIDRPVHTVGPPEVAAIGRDAESMRRRIVSELDTSRAATEALEQHSPVVSGLRRDLAARSVDDLEGVRVYGVLHPAEGVLAGDWWETVRRHNGTTALLVADVSGHGAEAGLVALRFKHRISALLRTNLALLTTFITAAEELDADDERFLSCLLIEVDPRTRALRWINAGHPSALLVRGSGDNLAVNELSTTGPLIGSLFSGWSVNETTIEPGQLLIAMTDGIVEARRGADEQFGLAGVVQTVRGLRRPDPKEAVTETVEAVRLFADDWRRDDVTCVALALDVEDD